MPGYFTGAESRAIERRGQTIENPSIPLSSANLLRWFGRLTETHTGESIGIQDSLTLSAFWAGVRMISETIGSLPLKVFQQDGRDKNEAREHYLWPLLHDNPSPGRKTTAMLFRETLQAHGLTWGNMYAQLVRQSGDGSGRVREMGVLKPSDTTRQPDGSYLTTDPRAGQRRLRAENVLHIPGLGFDGIHGYSVVAMARQSIALGLATEEFGAKWFAKGATPKGAFVHPHTLSEPAEKNIRESLKGGLDKAHDILVLEEGMKFEPYSLSPEDSQFLETRKFTVTEVARWLNMPPHKLREMSAATFSNIEHQSIEWVVDTIRPWTVRWQEAINAQVLTDADRASGIFVEFVLEELLRGDTEKRAGFYMTGIQTGSMTPNEIRRLENRNPIDGGDQAFIQLNMIPLSQAEAMLEGERALLMAADSGADIGGRLALPAPVETRATGTTFVARVRLRAAFAGLFGEAFARFVRGEVREIRRIRDRFLPRDVPGFVRELGRYYQDPVREFVRKTLFPGFEAYLGAVADSTLREVGRDDIFEEADRQGFADTYTEKFTTRYSRSSLRQIETVARDGGADAVTQRTEEWLVGGQGKPRADKWAHRELVQLGNATALGVIMAAGSTTVVSRATGTESCPYCEKLDGSVRGREEVFIQGGKDFEAEGADRPLTSGFDLSHPPYHAGCDCTIEAGD